MACCRSAVGVASRFFFPSLRSSSCWYIGFVLPFVLEMASGTSRQLTDDFYVERSRALPIPSELTSLLGGLLLDFECRLTTKIFDLIRTLTSLAAEVRRTALVENVPELVFERARRRDMGGIKEACCADRPGPNRHRPRTCACPQACQRGFLRLSAPSPLHQDDPNRGFGKSPLSSPFSQLLCGPPGSVALRKSPFSEHFVEEFSPFPGHGQRIRGEDYPVMRLSCGQTDFVFPPAHYADVDDDEEGVEDRSSVELRNIKKGDVGAVATPKAVTVGEIYLVRGHSYKVVSVTGGGMPYEVFGGDDLLVFDKPFPFNAKKTKGHPCLPVLIRAKHGFLPMSALDNFEPVKFRFKSSRAAAKLGQGSFEMEFCSLAFNDVLVCHRDSYLPPNVS